METEEDLFDRLGLSRGQMFDQSQREDCSGSWLFDCESGEYWWSKQTYRIYGLPYETVLSTDLFLAQIHEEDLAEARDAFDTVLEGRPYHFVHRLRGAKEVRWLEQRGRLYSGEGIAHPYVLGTVRDVTDIKMERQSLAYQRADFAAITQYLAETTDTTDLAAIVSSVKRTIRKRMDVAVIAVFVRQGDGVSRVIPHSMDPMQAFLFQETQDFVGYKAVMDGVRQSCPVAEYPTKLGRLALEQAGGCYVTALPIQHGGVTIGALSLVTRNQGPLRRGEDEFCRTICGYLSNQLNNALLYARLKQELVQRSRLESDREVIFNESVDFIAIISKGGEFAQINPAFAKRLGFLPEELLGRSVFDFIHPEDRAYAWQTFNSLPQKGVIRGFFNRFLCENNEIGYIENNLKYMEETGSTIAIARDLTGQRQIEERNTLLEQTLAFERTKSEFFAGLSHEFKTPLNIILSTLDLVRLKSSQENEDRFNKEYGKFFDYAYRNCYKLLRLSSNLLDSSKMESGYYRLHVTKVRLDLLLEDTVGAAEVYANAQKVRLEVCNKLGREVYLACDEDSVERIVLNLLSNAIKNSQEDCLVRVRLTEEGAHYRISVEDNGSGIPAEALPHIFDKFMTSANPLSGRREGSGIGLSLVKSLVELHGGTVRAESQVGEGSCFSFTLSKALAVTEEAEGPAVEAMAAHARLELSAVK